MSLVREQAVFLLHVSELIRKASELGFLASGGELYRTAGTASPALSTGAARP